MKKKEMKRLSLLLTLAFEGSWQWLSETNLKSLRKRNEDYIRLTLSNDLMLFWTFGDLPSCLVQRLVPLGHVFHLKKLQGARRGNILIMVHCSILLYFELGHPIVKQFNKSA